MKVAPRAIAELPRPGTSTDRMGFLAVAKAAPRFAENYPPPAHNASWRFEMGRIAQTANVSDEVQSER